MTNPISIRWMLRRDFPSVFRIDSQFEYPWTEGEFISCLRQRNVIGMVAEVLDEQVAGFMIYELHQKRINLLNFAVEPTLHRNGIGTAMVQKIVGKLSPQRRNRITLNVRETNLGAQLFFKSCGFRATEIVPSPYDFSDDDAYRMVLRVSNFVEVEAGN